MEEPETDIDKPYIKNLIDMAVDRSEHPLHPKPMKEGRDPINCRTVGVSAYSRIEGDKPYFYTPSADNGTSPSSPPSSSSKQMVVVTRHSQSLPSTKPLAVESSPAPLLSPAAPTTRGSPSHLDVPSVGRPPSTVGSQSSAGKKPSKSVSRLCFPFVKKKDKGKSVPGSVSANPLLSSSPGIPSPLSQPLESASSFPRRHKYACPPTRFSPLPAKGASPVQKHQRHAYANRGYSREGLEHVKWFWNVCHQGGIMEKKPPVARTVHPQTRGSVSEPPPSGARTPDATATAPTTTDSDGAQASIHPRRGDISTLRDPQYAEVDKAFGGMAAWTISKMVWMVEVDVGVERMEWEREKEMEREERRRRRSRLRMKILWDEHDSDDGDGDEGGTLDALNRSTSSSSLSEDSELTLVDDELLLKEGTTDTDEDDDEGLVIRGRKPTPQCHCRAESSDRSIHSARSFSSSLSTTPSVSPTPELLDLEMDRDKSDIGRYLARALFQTRLDVSKSTKLTGCCQPEWATDWTSRWEIVRNLSQAQRDVGFL